MSDHSGSSFALGYLAAGSATDLANDVAMTIVHGRRKAAPVVSLADYQTLLDENQRLRSHAVSLEAEVARLQVYSTELRSWGRGLYDQLAALKTR